MRRRATRRGNDQADVNMTPMLDIVFILLIFFIVTATFLQEQGIDITPPPEPEEDQPRETNPVIFVQVDDSNRVFVNQEPTSELRVLAAVSRIRAEQPNSAVLIEVDDEAEHGTLIYLMDEMRANSIPVSFSRRENEE